MTESNPLIISVKCPDCGHEFKCKINVPRPDLKIRHVKCLGCGHEWTYNGLLKNRIRCPLCGSSKNDVNRKTFGRFNIK